MTTPHERSFRVMGCAAYVVVHDGPPALLDVAEARLRELESLWSRFLPNSDITRANQAGGTPVAVHPDTLAIVARALEGWRQTGGRFDITSLPALVDAGYTHSVVDGTPAPRVTGTQVGQSPLVQVNYRAGTITVPATTAIDLGGIGKGFAADVVAEELVEAGAGGALVNLGGDIAVQGSPSNDQSWYFGVDDPRTGAAPGTHVALLRIAAGGVATSGTTVRRWTTADGSTAHHVIDPRVLRPSNSDVRIVTVVAADAATAEVFATAAMQLPAAEAMAMLDGVGLAGLAVTEADEVVRSTTFASFAVEPQST